MTRLAQVATMHVYDTFAFMLVRNSF